MLSIKLRGRYPNAVAGSRAGEIVCEDLDETRGSTALN